MNNAFKIDGQRLLQGFNADADSLLSSFDNYTNEYPFLVMNLDSSTGTDSGYALTSSQRGNSYVLRTMVDTLADGNLQSFCYNYNNNKYYRFDASTTAIVYNSSLVKEGTITLPSNPGHTNDACFYNGIFYLPGGYFGASVAEGTKVYTWNPQSNTLGSVSINVIGQPSNGSTRVIMGICVCSYTDGKLLLVCQDCTSSELVHNVNDKMSVYEYDIELNVATLVAEFPWDCVYVQGATLYDGILYVACNTQTTGTPSNYKGVTVKVIRTDIWSLIDELICDGVFEPEGMDVVPSSGGYEIGVGLGHYRTISLALRFTVPYSLPELS